MSYYNTISREEAYFLAALPYKRSFYRDLHHSFSQLKEVKLHHLLPIITANYSKAKLRELWHFVHLYEKTKEMSFRIQNKTYTYKYVYLGDSHYPDSLRNIYDPPLVLFYTDSVFLNLSHNFAVVGTRSSHPLSYAAIDHLLLKLKKEYAQQSGSSSQKIAIVSGFARGIDRNAHILSLEHNLHTIAILASGLPYISPISNWDILNKSSKNSKLAFVSEFPPWSKASKFNFPRRNRLIAGLCSRIFIIQAPEKSGACITARFGLEEGREVLCFDHQAFDAWEGCNAGCRILLESGAQKIKLPSLEKRIFHCEYHQKFNNKKQLETWKQVVQGSIPLGKQYYLKNK